MIATFTDFGNGGPYLGQVHAAILSRFPAIPVIDLFTDLPAFSAKPSSYLVRAFSAGLPEGSVCLCVVDPGVGGERGVIAVETAGRWFVAPDNGLLSRVLFDAPQASCFEICWRPETLSASFHGRDLFAPVAGMIASGAAVSEWGRPTVREQLCLPDWPADLAEVVYIDHYGNAMTGLRAASLTEGQRLGLGRTEVRYARVFDEAADATPFWYENANGLVELALRGASIAGVLGIAVGDPVELLTD